MRLSPGNRRLLSITASVGSAVAFFVAILTFVVAPIRGTFSGAFEDFNAYLEAGNGFLHHVSPYAPAAAYGRTVALEHFTYPPPVAVMVSPLAAMPYGAAQAAWLTLGLASLMAGTLIAAMAVLPPSLPRVRIAVLSALLFPLATYNLWHGQMNQIIFLMMAAALWCYVNRKYRLFAAIIAVATAIKLAPALLALMLIRRRLWAALAIQVGLTVAIFGAGILAVGVDATRFWFQVVLPVLSRGNGWLYNQSWNGVLHRLLNNSVLEFQTTPLWLTLSVLLFELTTVWFLWTAIHPRREDKAQLSGEFAVAVCAMLLAATITWLPHTVHMLLVLPVAVGLVRTGNQTANRRLIGAGLFAAAVLVILTPYLVDHYSAANQPRGLSWWLYLQIWSLPALSILGVMLALRSVLGTGGAGVAPAASSQRHFEAGSPGLAEVRPTV